MSFLNIEESVFWNKNIKKHSVFLLSICLYAVLALSLLRFYRYQLNPDGISYISIAQKYLAHNFHDAVNGFWGPLFSWLLIPFLSIGLQSLLAAKVLSLIIGLGTLIGVRLLLNSYGLSNFIVHVLSILFVPLILYFSLILITPDLLMVCVITYYLAIVFSLSYKERIYMGILSGVLGGMIYLTKSYGLPFFIAHFSVTNLLRYFQTENSRYRKIILCNFLCGFIAFIIISGAWIAALSSKYDEFTFSTAGKYNISALGPDVKWDHFSSLIKPPNKTAISAWEDPSLIETEQWEITESWDSVKHYIKRIFHNLSMTITTFKYFSILCFAITITSILYCMNMKKVNMFNNIIFYTLVTMALYSSGYVMLLIVQRYIWIDCILMIILGVYFLDLLFRNHRLNSLSKYVLIVLFMLSFWRTPLTKIYANINSGFDHFKLSGHLKNDCCIHGRVASNSEWKCMLCLSFHNGWKYYGKTGDKFAEQNILKMIKENDIDYYFVWNISDERLNCLSGFDEVTGGNIENLRVYSMR